MSTVIHFFMITFFSISAHAQASSSAEVMCRAQAKEAAVQAYSGCITTARNNQVEQIRNDYKKEMADLKSKYDKELKKLSGDNKTTAKAKKANPVTVKEVATKAPKATKGIATQLPGRNSSDTEATPVQHINEGTAVVAASPGTEYRSDSSIEAEAAQADQFEVIEMPVE